MPNVFLLGRPGCGKSAVFRILEEALRASGYKGKLTRLDDFPLLKQMFDSDTEFKRHRPAPGGGVKVTDDTVWDDLIKGLDVQARKLQGKDHLLFIEFSRDSYARAFKNFSPEVLNDSLAIYIDAPFDVCWARNVRRVEKEREMGHDSHLVSREEMEKTYARDDGNNISKFLKIPVMVVKNDTDDVADLKAEMEKVIAKIKEMIK